MVPSPSLPLLILLFLSSFQYYMYAYFCWCLPLLHCVIIRVCVCLLHHRCTIASSATMKRTTTTTTTACIRQRNRQQLKNFMFFVAHCSHLEREKNRSFAGSICFYSCSSISQFSFSAENEHASNEKGTKLLLSQSTLRAFSQKKLFQLTECVFFERLLTLNRWKFQNRISLTTPHTPLSYIFVYNIAAKNSIFFSFSSSSSALNNKNNIRHLISNIWQTRKISYFTICVCASFVRLQFSFFFARFLETFYTISVEFSSFLSHNIHQDLVMLMFQCFNKIMAIASPRHTV